MENLAQDGDGLIVFREVDENVLERDHDAVREEARKLMRSVQEKSAGYAVDRKGSCGSLANFSFRAALSSLISIYLDLLFSSLPTTLSHFLSFPHLPSSSLSSLIALQLTPFPPTALPNPQIRPKQNNRYPRSPHRSLPPRLRRRQLPWPETVGWVALVSE